MSALGDPFSSGGSVATAINANGSTVGYALPVNSGFPSYSGPVVWENGLVATVGTTPSTGVFTGINASGQASGYSNIHALRFGNGTLTDLGTLGATYGRSGATGINDNGQLCGYASLSGTNSANTVHAFLYGTGAMTDLGSLGGNSYASAINASGQVAGVSYLSNNLTLHAVLYDHGSILDLPTLGTNSYAFAINNRADIVGYYYESGNSSTFRAFLFSGGVMQDLNSTIDPGSGFTLQSAEGINNVGQIVGYGTNVYGQTHGFLLTPVPEPSALVWIGVVGMIVHRRLRVSLQKSCRVLHRRPILIA